MNINESINTTTGHTPLVRLTRSAQGAKADVLAKLEYFNPLSSVKCRIGIAMIEAAESQGLINSDTTVVEPTSGNTGLALAFACAAKNYRLILTMPETMSVERRSLLQASWRRTRSDTGKRGDERRYCKGERDSGNLRQIHSCQTSLPTPPTLKSTGGPRQRKSGMTQTAKWTYSYAGVGTGGTITGVSEVIKSRKTFLLVCGS